MSTTHTGSKTASKEAVMTKSLHATGPWRTECDHEGMWQIWSKGCRWIAKIFGSTAEADARLIAAAPELLEALESIATPEGFRLPAKEWEELDLFKKARSAISKARGEADLAA